MKVWSFGCCHATFHIIIILFLYFCGLGFSQLHMFSSMTFKIRLFFPLLLPSLCSAQLQSSEFILGGFKLSCLKSMQLGCERHLFSLIAPFLLIPNRKFIQRVNLDGSGLKTLFEAKNELVSNSIGLDVNLRLVISTYCTSFVRSQSISYFSWALPM